MNHSARPATSDTGTDTALLQEMIYRVQDMEDSYRALARKMGKLYMQADEKGLASLNQQLDKPMRNASENERIFASILESLRLQINQSG